MDRFKESVTFKRLIMRLNSPLCVFKNVFESLQFDSVSTALSNLIFNTFPLICSQHLLP